MGQSLKPRIETLQSTIGLCIKTLQFVCRRWNAAPNGRISLPKGGRTAAQTAHGGRTAGGARRAGTSRARAAWWAGLAGGRGAGATYRAHAARRAGAARAGAAWWAGTAFRMTSQCGWTLLPAPGLTARESGSLTRPSPRIHQRTWEFPTGKKFAHTLRPACRPALRGGAANPCSPQPDSPSEADSACSPLIPPDRASVALSHATRRPPMALRRGRR